MTDAGAIRIPTLTSEFPVVSDDPHIDAPLRATVRRLSTLLGRTLADQHGPELLELVEDVRRQAKEAKASGDPDRERKRYQRDTKAYAVFSQPGRPVKEDWLRKGLDGAVRYRDM